MQAIKMFLSTEPLCMSVTLAMLGCVFTVIVVGTIIELYNEAKFEKGRN